MQNLFILDIILPAGKGAKNMKKKYKAICTLKENSQEYTIYRNLDNNRFYKEIDGKYEKLSLEDSKFYKGIEKISDKINHDEKIKIRKENIRKAGKFTYKAATVLLILSLLGVGAHAYYVQTTPRREYKHSEKTEDDVMQLFIKSMELNRTINQSCAEDIKKYLKVFVDECNNLGIDNDKNYIKIAKMLYVMNFSDKESLSYGDLCEMFDFRNGNFIAAELYNHLEKVTFNYRYNTIANYLYFNEDVKRDVLSGNSVKIEINDKTFNLNLKKLDKNDEELYDLLNENVCECLGINDPNSYLCRANMFSSVIEKYSYNKELFYYYELQEDGNLKNVSYREYFKKLALLVYTEGDELDYNNEKDRALVYLYMEALRLNFGRQWTDEPTEYILLSIVNGDNLYLPIISQEDLLRYLNGRPLDIESLVELGELAMMGEETLGYLQELNKCFKVEVSLGNLSQEEYEYFVDMVIEAIEILYPERLEEFTEANLYNNSLEGFELKLFPDNKL